MVVVATIWMEAESKIIYGAAFAFQYFNVEMGVVIIMSCDAGDEADYYR